jgi:arylsulfatase
MSLLLALALALPVAAGSSGDRPNVVVILTDDAGYSDPSCYGGEVSTPHIDALAAGGVRFRTFYTNARCSPTRASLLTGQYAQSVGVGDLCGVPYETPYPGYRGFLDPGVVTLAELLGDAGYRTMMVGKWHLGGTRVQFGSRRPPEEERAKWPTRQGFERFFGIVHGETGYFAPRDERPYRLNEALFVPGDGFYATDAYSERAADWLGELRASGNSDPFFLYLAYTAPHSPREAPERLIERYRPLYTEHGGRELEAARYERMLAKGVIPAEWGLRVWSKEKPDPRIAEFLAVTAAMTERLDAGIGRVVAKLRELGELDDTLLLLLSDNGATGAHRYLGNTPFVGQKGTLEEGGTVTHAVLHWPAAVARPDRWTSARAHVIDVVPTVLEAVGVAYPDRRGEAALPPLAGTSLLPVVRDEPWERGAPLFFDLYGWSAVIEDGWKLLRDPEGTTRLFDLEADGTETTDRAADEPERLAALEAAFAAWAERCHVLPYDEVKGAQRKFRKDGEGSER